MKNKKYIVSRDNIYVGEVIRAYEIYRYEGPGDLFETKPGELTTSCWDSYRSMLFTLDSDMKSNDLLYKTKAYPILNITNDNLCLSLKEEIVIQRACNLALLLEYFNYKKDLTYEDIITIRNTFFNGRFAKDNCELFGWKEIKPEDLTYYKNGVKINDLKELKKRIEQERRLQQAGYRLFNRISEHQLPRYYWDILDDLGDLVPPNPLLEFEENTNAFIPNKKEVYVKKLRRF